MSKLFAVGFISFHDNELHIEMITADSWQAAVPQHSKIGRGEGNYCWWLDGEGEGKLGEEYSDNELENWKQAFFDQDAMFGVKEIV